jgi:hypothetical protein
MIPVLEEVMQTEKDGRVAKNARIAIEKIKSRGASTDSVKFIRRYKRVICHAVLGTYEGTYEEYSAPDKSVARAFLQEKNVTKDYFYIEVITPEGNVGKDKMGIY